MATQFIDKFAEALNDRADRIAAAQNTDAVDAIVQEAKVDAVLRTPIPNTFVYQVTVVVLGLSVLAVIAAQLWITLDKIPGGIPDGIIAIGSAAIGALAGLLAPTATN